MRHPYPVHGRRWSIWHPFGWSCRCGLEAWPCAVVRMQQRDAIAAAREWSADERARRSQR